MGASLIIGFREGLEAALVVGLVVGVLSRTNAEALKRYVWFGVLAAVGCALLLGGGLFALGRTFTGRGAQLFEGGTMLVAALVLTWMIFWMEDHGREISRRLVSDTEEALSVGKVALFLVAFTAVLREGVETALFLMAAIFRSSWVDGAIGAALGIALAVGVGILIFRWSVNVNVTRFFRVTGVLLLFIAAGLIAHGIHEFQEMGLLPVFVEELWNVNSWLDEEGPVGSFLKALFGYNGNPSLLEVLSYTLYLALAGGAMVREA